MDNRSKKWNYLPDIDATTFNLIREEYRKEILKGHVPSVLTQPIAIACTGLVASGKSTIMKPLATTIDAVTISTDIIRERFFTQGFNFKLVRDLVAQLLDSLVAENYNLNLDFNVANDLASLDVCAAHGYRIFILHTNPPESFIRRKVLSGSMNHNLTFFGSDNNVLELMLANRDDHLKRLNDLKAKYPIWREIDTSNNDLSQIITDLKTDFQVELTKK